MKTILIAIALLKICLTAHGGVLTATSPDKRYSIIFRHTNGESFLPDVCIHESLTGFEKKLIVYTPIKKRDSSFNALWSPDSRHVAVTLTGLLNVNVPDILNGVNVWRIRGRSGGMGFRVSQLEFLPLPKAIDAKKVSFFGSTSANNWEGNEFLWISDSSKNRFFRYRLTKNGRMLADASKDFPKN